MVTKSGNKVFDTPRVPEEDSNIFYPEDDDEPMAENDAQRRALIDTSETLIEHFAERTDVYVSADMFIYYEMDNPNRKVAPDVFVSFGVSDHWRGSYFTWREGKAPDFVLEVASPGTWARDAAEKRDIYAAMGVTEYWRFDPNRGEFFLPPLIGERLNLRSEYDPIPLTEVDGILRGHSSALGLDICVREHEIRLYDPTGGSWLRNHREEAAARRIAEERAEHAQERAQHAQERAEHAEERAQLLERLLRERGITPPGGG